MDFDSWYMDAEHGWMAHVAESGGIKVQLRMMFVAVGFMFTANLGVFVALVAR
jgi:hypothetical protein